MTDLRPQPAQERFLSSSADIVLYGGAAGGGKSFALILEGLRHAHVPGMTTVVFRRTMPQIRQPGGLWDTSQAIYPYTGAQSREQTTEWRWPSGAWLKMSHLQHDDDRFTWDGSQIACVMFDELQHFSEQVFWYILGRNRSVCGVKPYVRGTLMPDASHWTREFVDWYIGPDGQPIPERAGVIRWFIRNEDGEIEWVAPDYLGPQGERPKSFTFIPANVYDNPALLDANPGYVDSLRALEPVERQRLLEGNWNARPIMVGRIYPEFDPGRHFAKPHTVESVEELLHAFSLYEAWDFGSGAASATATVWAYFDKSDDRLYLWDWFADYEQPVEHYAQEVAARGYRTKHNPQGRLPYERLGDPAGRQRDAEQKHWFGRLSAEHGIELRPAVNRPNESIQTVKWALREGRIRLHPRCAHKLPVGPLSGGRRTSKSLSDAFQEYVWNVPDDYDPAVASRPGADKPRKNWASHPMNAVEYICREIWGYVAPGVQPAGRVIRPGG